MMAEFPEEVIKKVASDTGLREEEVREIAKRIPVSPLGRLRPKLWAKFRCVTCIGPVRKAIWCLWSVI